MFDLTEYLEVFWNVISWNSLWGLRSVFIVFNVQRSPTLKDKTRRSSPTGSDALCMFHRWHELKSKFRGCCSFYYKSCSNHLTQKVWRTLKPEGIKQPDIINQYSSCWNTHTRRRQTVPDPPGAILTCWVHVRWTSRRSCLPGSLWGMKLLLFIAPLMCVNLICGRPHVLITPEPVRPVSASSQSKWLLVSRDLPPACWASTRCVEGVAPFLHDTWTGSVSEITDQVV